MKPLILIIMDGIGISDNLYGNAFASANTPNLDYLFNNYPHAELVASGIQVGLPKGQMGNSEVGHLNIGAGRVVDQSLNIIDKSIRSGSFFKDEDFINAINYAIKNDSKIHIIGLISDGGIHSHVKHILSLINMAKEYGAKKIHIHAITDGRDTDPRSSITYINMIDQKMKQLGLGSIATISGRFYAMDRDNKWERTKKAYEAMVNGRGSKFSNYTEAIEASYGNDITDEFIEPLIIDENGNIEENDSIIWANFRPDRARQILGLISGSELVPFAYKHIDNLLVTTMMNVNSEIISKEAISSLKLENTLGEVLENNKLKQLRIAETEKFAHVTYFFDGGKKADYSGKTEILIPSPKVRTYDMLPKMSAETITNKLMVELEKNVFDFILLNFANGDMVGHTGNLEAAIKACEEVDKQIGIIYQEIKRIGGTMIITADHGNCEEMLDINHNIVTKHSTNKVPFLVTDKNYYLDDGRLANISPTILEIMDIKLPLEMNENSLINSKLNE